MSLTGLRGWIDYDREKLPGLSPEERLDYFEIRVRLVALRPLQRILEREVWVEEGPSSALLILGVSACCVIEALGKFLSGKPYPSNAARFYSFVDRYLDADFRSGDIGGKTRAQCLWHHYRNGLAHGFVVSHGGFEGSPSEAYFKTTVVAGRAALNVNPTRFIGDVISGFERYLADLRASEPEAGIRKAFADVFQDVFIDGED